MDDALSGTRRVLCLNRGSATLKFALWEMGGGETRLGAGTIPAIGNTRAAIASVFTALDDAHLPTPDAVGHRVVHGGPDHTRPERVDARLLESLRRVVPLARLHQPAALEAIEIVLRDRPDLPQVACFDTAFHHVLPEVARLLPLPRALAAAGVRRYGFHGLSYEYVVSILGPAALKRAVLAHVGSGVSLVAVEEGAPIETTMGLTPTGGVMMATRTGDLDPGTLLYLLMQRGYDADALEHLVENESGLLGVSGSSGDMRVLLERRATEPHAARAVELFCRELRKHVGALAAVLGGIDTLVFTGGVGEHAAPVREEVCEGLEHLGIRLDRERNARHAGVISTDDIACTVRVVATDEERMIARHTAAVLAESAS